MPQEINNAQRTGYDVPTYDVPTHDIPNYAGGTLRNLQNPRPSEQPTNPKPNSGQGYSAVDGMDAPKPVRA